MKLMPRLTLALVALALCLPAVTAEPASDTVADGIVAYYFHGDVRCRTCRTLEAYSEEAITGGFAGEVASGRLRWRAVNTDEAENAHFVKDFQLVTKALVLVEYRDGKVVRFEDLKLIWQLVGDKAGFLKYVRDATAEFLKEG